MNPSDPVVHTLKKGREKGKERNGEFSLMRSPSDEVSRVKVKIFCFLSPPPPQRLFCSPPPPPFFFTHWTKTLLTCIWADTVFQTQEGDKDANWLLFPMVTSSKTCTQHATPQTSTPSPSFPQTVPPSLHHPSLHVQAADLSRWEKRITGGGTCLQS